MLDEGASSVTIFNFKVLYSNSKLYGLNNYIPQNIGVESLINSTN